MTKELQQCNLEDIIDTSLKNNDFQQAIIHLNKHLEKNPNDALAYNKLGYAYDKLDPFKYIEIQTRCFEKAIELQPFYKNALFNLAVAYPKTGKNEKALELYDKILRLNPSMDDYFNYACLNLKLKFFEEGWENYEDRFETKEPVFYPQINKPRWKGEEINGKTLLVHWEQGYGDMIMSSRFLKKLSTYTNKIIFKVQDSLYDLFKANFKNIEIVKDSSPINEINFDYHVPIMSLMSILKINDKNIPCAEGYLKADKEKSAFYKKHFFDNDCLKIGIAWHGRENGVFFRDIPLKTFFPLTKIKKVKIYSFQKDTGANEIQNLPQGIEIIDIASNFKNFDDTAAAIENLDFFISSDTCNPHLAGAMGKKTFLLLHKSAEWRWFSDTETSPWYESIKIFRKKSDADSWDILMNKVIETILQNASNELMIL